jgi:hypothetical protein
MRGIGSSHFQSPPRASRESLPLFDERFSSNHLPGSFNDDSLVRGIITDTIKRCGKSREEIAEQMEALLAVQITARMIASFTAESKELHRWPGAWDRAFCKVTGDFRLLRCRVELAGYHVIDGAEADLLELGREFLRQKRASERVSFLESRLVGVEI